MVFAQGSRSNLGYVTEVTFGTTPGTPSLIELPFNSSSLNLTKESLESAENRADRMTDVFRHGNRSVSGEIEVDFRATDFDALIESAMFSAFSTNVIKIGTTMKHFSVEERALDIAQYRLFTGMTVNSWSLSVRPNEIVKATFGFVGKNMTISGTSADATMTAAAGTDPFDSFSGTITEGGAAIASVTSLEFSVDNGLNPTFAIGASTTPQLEYGRANIKGTIQAYFENATLLNKFLNETVSSLEFALTDGTNTYTFLLPEIKYTGGDIPISSEQSRIVSLPFIALKDGTQLSPLKITKS